MRNPYEPPEAALEDKPETEGAERLWFVSVSLWIVLFVLAAATTAYLLFAFFGASGAPYGLYALFNMIAIASIFSLLNWQLAGIAGVLAVWLAFLGAHLLFYRALPLAEPSWWAVTACLALVALGGQRSIWRQVMERLE